MCCIVLQQVCVNSLFCCVCDVALFGCGLRAAGRSGRVTTGLHHQGSEKGGGAGPTQGDRQWVKCAALDQVLVRTLHLSSVFLQIG